MASLLDSQFRNPVIVLQNCRPAIFACRDAGADGTMIQLASDILAQLSAPPASVGADTTEEEEDEAVAGTEGAEEEEPKKLTQQIIVSLFGISVSYFYLFLKIKSQMYYFVISFPSPDKYKNI
jgi:hypothetical protein